MKTHQGGLRGKLRLLTIIGFSLVLLVIGGIISLFLIEIEDVIYAKGKIASEITYDVISHLDGRVVRLNFDEGDDVKEGDVIAQVDAIEYEEEQVRIESEIREYEAEDVAPEFATLKKTLVEMAAQYEQACALVHGHDNTYIDFHARRLVEMAGHIIMGWLLVLDAGRCADFAKSARVFVGKAKSWNQERYDYIAGFSEEDLADFIN